MTIVYRAPITEPPIPRPTFHEACQSRTCTSVYVAGVPDPELLRTWRLAHAKHWEEEDVP
jgi:hypothetical protein